MGIINILSEDLANKIAAGEVVERPASIVKELVENSLDARATEIKIEITNSGQDLIRITDNGEGMSPEDTKKSILRHATSKISTDEDLFSIETLGFRGEALASIAAVSKLTITSKQADGIEAYRFSIEGGKPIGESITASSQGTSIEVKDLFFNTPARKKFLKTDAVELRHIIDTITNYALLNKTVSFHLLHEGHTLLNSPRTDDQRNNIASIYGTKTAKDLLELNYDSKDIQINGYISTPYNCRNDRAQQLLFINQRWIKNKELTQSIYDAYQSLLFVNKHPLFVLQLSLNPREIDVNVHPQKFEVKIEQIDRVKSILNESIMETLKENNLMPVVSVSEEQITFGFTPKPLPKKPSSYSFEPSHQKTFTALTPTPMVLETPQLSEPTVESNELTIESNHQQKLPVMKLLGQVHKTFFVAETEGGLILIDQHAVHERIQYEKYLKQFMDQSIETQTLLQGGVMEFSPQEALTLNANLTLFQQFGYTIEPFGGNTFILKTVPVLFNRLQGPNSFLEFFAAFQEDKNSLLEMKEKIIARMACRSAVMAGDDLTIDRMNSLLRELEKSDHPYTCAHGRPSIIKITADELEKKFRRKGC